ncbi:uncharacterized protein, partial [Diadema antillarum]|uniref:uncharacterized protein n=1 Tax=Diadema antillarum TaxID=105358 RepID=UPI003A86E0F4
MRELQTLSLVGNLLTEIPVFSNNTSLRSLLLSRNAISDNRISWISSDAFPSSMTYLSLKGNRLTELSSVDGFPNLQTLYLPMYRFPISPRLALINLNNNPLFFIDPSAFLTTPQITKLYLENT